MSDPISELIKHLTYEQYCTVAGSDWPSYTDLISSQNIPDFVVKEIKRFFPKLGKKNHIVEFYITNVCNLTCSNCRSFNNFEFDGHYEFDINLYQSWANKIDIHSYVLLGGEPLLHPNLKDWVEGLRSLWPRAQATIDSNGTHMTKVKNLHSLLVENRYVFRINVHSPALMNKILRDINKSFGECEQIHPSDQRNYYIIENEDPPQDDVYLTWLLSSRGLPICIVSSWSFFGTPSGTTNWNNLINNVNITNSIFTGDPVKAHEQCRAKKCHIMLEGKIYKCAVVATLPVFLKQHNIKWPNDLVYQYNPITIDDFSDDAMSNLANVIPQCTFCATGEKILPLDKKGKKKVFFPITNKS